MIEIEIKLFGAFKKYVNQKTPILLKSKTPLSMDQIKNAISSRLTELSPDFGKTGVQLLKDSAIACETQVLFPNAVVMQSCSLSILPPVCGG